MMWPTRGVTRTLAHLHPTAAVNALLLKVERKRGVLPRCFGSSGVDSADDMHHLTDA